MYFRGNLGQRSCHWEGPRPALEDALVPPAPALHQVERKIDAWHIMMVPCLHISYQYDGYIYKYIYTHYVYL